eukprot:TRINITY_DN7901_c0_g1_i1.p1 TRINITY_DN7901_c0_g1~~TRINITY_DN7901_c0_g1_i1.p1  ORF type:complete len:123 (+),score=20.29 TRINITY_DN7901_c0_g1_i1:45-413(+)
MTEVNVVCRLEPRGLYETLSVSSDDDVTEALRAKGYNVLSRTLQYPRNFATGNPVGPSCSTSPAPNSMRHALCCQTCKAALEQKGARLVKEWTSHVNKKFTKELKSVSSSGGRQLTLTNMGL